MNYRKDLKARARKSLREHYGIWVILCVIYLVIPGNQLFVYNFEVELVQEGYENDWLGLYGMRNQFTDIVEEFLRGGREEGKKLTEEIIQEEVESSRKKGNTVFGRSRGVLSMIVNRLTSGAFLVSIIVGISTIAGSDSAAVAILIVISLFLLFAFWFLIINVYQVIMIRMFLEGMRYPKIHTQRVLFLLKVKKWVQASRIMFTVFVYELLWSFTIVGGFIKYYSYYLTPYIAAENPGLKAKEAVTLSRKLMKGHKWELFVLQVSFLGWEILGALTADILSIFFTRPYKTAVYCEFYERLRRLGKEKGVEGAELLNDVYLFEKPHEPVMELVYGDVIREYEKPVEKYQDLKGIHKLLASAFGITVLNRKREMEFEHTMEEQLRLAYDKEALDGKIYPTRLSPFPEKEKRRWLSGTNYLRCYSIWSLILIFFAMSFGGWLWEVFLHLIADGRFVNRGVLHGPWLPIYGAGSVLILLILYRFRKNPALEFFLTVVLCGIVEYSAAYYLEMTHNGKKWWDYTGYFLNLNGRVCAEGLFVFGVGGMIIVYVLAPVLDNLIRRLPHNVVLMVCASLVILFSVDQGYSREHPNEGRGITAALLPEDENRKKWFCERRFSA